MMHYIRLNLGRSFALFSIFSLSIPSTVIGTDIALQQVGSWNVIDACAQSCAISASTVFSSLASCPSSDPASCICNVAPAVSAVAGAAHQCATTSCTAFPSYAEDAERARVALSYYCWSNGITNTGTPVRTPASSTAMAIATTSSIRKFCPYLRVLSACIKT